MGLFDFLKSKKVSVDSDANFSEPQNNSYPSNNGVVYGTQYPIITKYFDGEKTLGELGAVINSIPDYQRLSLRSYDAYLKTDTVKILTQKHVDWAIGSGLKLQCEPDEDVLKFEGIDLSGDKLVLFKKKAESRFNLYANSKYADYARQRTLNQLANDFYKAKRLSGDVLVICRIEATGPSVQFVSGSHVKTPDAELLNSIPEKNYEKNGIEFNERGEHVAYFVQTKSKNNLLGKFERIACYGEKSKRKLSWMIYGEKISPDHVRAIPQLTQTLEKVSKLDRYTEATVGKAEQGANIPYTIEHDQYSTGEDILTELKNKKNNIVIDADANHKIADGLANKITETTSNRVYNMPVGAKLKGLPPTTDTSYEAFERANFNKIAASGNIPPEVALQMYNSNYSASRAAINGWGYVVDIDRTDFAIDFYIPFYKIWLEIEILKNKIEAPGFVSNLGENGDFMIIEAYSKCRFIGKNMPHIDPLKEAKSVELMISLGLISREQATEMLNLGEWYSNNQKIKEEDKIIYKPVITDTNGTV